MKRKIEVELDAIDLLLGGAIVAMSVLIVVLLLPVALPWLQDVALGAWRVGRTVVRFWRWPWWIWTVLGVLMLGVLLWLRERYE